MSTSAKVFLLTGVLALAGTGVWLWRRFGPAIAVIASDVDAAKEAIVSVPSASVEEAHVKWLNGHKVLVVRWRGNEDLDEQALGAACDAAWAQLEPKLEGQYDSVLIAAMVGKKTQVDLGVVSASYSDRRSAAFRVYGQPMDEEMVADLLDD